MQDGPAESLDFVVREGDTLWTQSRLKVWWFTRFDGYRIIAVRLIPRETAFGLVRYSRKWLIGKTRDHARVT